MVRVSALLDWERRRSYNNRYDPERGPSLSKYRAQELVQELEAKVYCPKKLAQMEEDREDEYSITSMYNVPPHEHAYAVLYARFARRFPDLAIKLPRPQFVQDTSPSAPPFSVQQQLSLPPSHHFPPAISSSLPQPRPRAEQYGDDGRPSPLQCRPTPVLPATPLPMLSPTALSSSPQLLPPSPLLPESLPSTPPSPTLDLPPAPPFPFPSSLPSLPPVRRRLQTRIFSVACSHCHVVASAPRCPIASSVRSRFPPQKDVLTPKPRRPTFSTRLKRPQPQRRHRCLRRRSRLKTYQRGLHHL